jgi:hypothetical protein
VSFGDDALLLDGPHVYPLVTVEYLLDLSHHRRESPLCAPSLPAPRAL